MASKFSSKPDTSAYRIRDDTSRRSGPTAHAALCSACSRRGATMPPNATALANLGYLRWSSEFSDRHCLGIESGRDNHRNRESRQSR
jgi:hypothetical protein